MIFHSIKWRLQAWHGFLLLCLVSGLLAGFYIFERREKLLSLDTELGEAMTYLLPRYAPPSGRPAELRPPEERNPPVRPGENGPPGFEGGGFPPPGPEGRQPILGRPGLLEPREDRGAQDRFFSTGKLYFIVWAETGERIAESPGAPEQVVVPKGSRPNQGRLIRTRGDAREMMQSVPTGRIILVGASVTAVRTQLNHLAVALVVIGVGIVGAGFAVGWWLASKALRPVAEISRAAQEIAAGDLSQRINASETESELGQLAAVLNSTFARLDAAFAQQRQFTSDAAHELRTPVSVILTQTQSTLNKERSGPEYRETLEACQRAAQRMKKLVESLLELARLDGGQATGRREPVDLARCAEECVALVLPLATERNIQIRSELTPASCTGDADQLVLVIMNLLTNAVHHNRDGGEVRIRTSLEQGRATVTVTDTGPGIEPGHLPHIFDRFYRADTARTSSSGRTGLGLSIARTIIELHGGTIDVASTPGQGSTFVVKVPVSDHSAP